MRVARRNPRASIVWRVGEGGWGKWGFLKVESIGLTMGWEWKTRVEV